MKYTCDKLSAKQRWQKYSTEQRRAVVLKETSEGKTPAQIARKYGGSSAGVCSILERLIETGELNAKTGMNFTVNVYELMTEYQRMEYVKRRYMDGFTGTEIAKEIAAKASDIHIIVENLLKMGLVKDDVYRFEPRTDIESLDRELDEYSGHYADAIYEDDREPDARKYNPQWPIS